MISNGRGMAVACQCLEVFRFPVMQSTFCFPNIEIITVPATSLINYYRPKGAVESVFVGEKRLNSASVPENNLMIKTTVELINTGFKLLSDNFALNT